MKVVINKCFGGFRLSDQAYERLIELGVPVRPYIEQKKDKDGRYQPEPLNDGQIIFDRMLSAKQKHRVKLFGRYWDTWTDSNRSHPLVVQVVEELGEAASSPLSRLKVVEVPDGVDWEIDDYDGKETIREVSRSWG